MTKWPRTYRALVMRRAGTARVKGLATGGGGGVVVVGAEMTERSSVVAGVVDCVDCVESGAVCALGVVP
jgi:hypothetical protein